MFVDLKAHEFELTTKEDSMVEPIRKEETLALITPEVKSIASTSTSERKLEELSNQMALMMRKFNKTYSKMKRSSNDHTRKKFYKNDQKNNRFKDSNQKWESNK